MHAGHATDPWPLPFTAAEYAERLQNVRAEMARRGLDLLYVTSPPNLTYLLGHRCVWFDGRNVTGLAIPLDGEAIYFDTPDHASGWPPTITTSVTYGDHGFYYPEGPSVVAATLSARGALHGRVGLEYWSWAPAGPALADLTNRLQANGAETVLDGSFVVDHVRLVKSPAELDCVRRALSIADAAHTAVRDALAPGVTEKELMGLYYQTCARLGGDEPGIRMMVHAGDHSNAFHLPASERAIAAGELLMVDMSAACEHYHGNTARAFSLGDNPRWADALARLEEGLLETTAQMQPGDPTMKLQRAMDDFVDRVGLRDLVWWVGGYVIGLSHPPDWVGHVYLNDEEGFEAGVMVPGFVANWEIQLEDPPAHEGVGLIETMIMTEQGIELPARFPRTLSVV